GDGAALLANLSIGADVSVGRGTTLHPGVVIGDRCKVGQACILYGGVVIGADGFGYRPAADGRGLVKIPHIGNVEIGDGAVIAAKSGVINDVPAGETWWGFPAMRSREMARSMAVYRYLPEMAKAVRNIAKKVGVEFSPGKAGE